MNKRQRKKADERERAGKFLDGMRDLMTDDQLNQFLRSAVSKKRYRTRRAVERANRLCDYLHHRKQAS